MNISKPYSLNVGGRLMDLTVPLVLGIVNCTPDSFFKLSRAEVGKWTEDVADADIIDVGAYSTRPGHGDVSVEEEKERLRRFLPEMKERVGENVVISVDTFRAEVARMCVEEYGVGIVNDVSGGVDEGMFETVAELGVPYVLTDNPEDGFGCVEDSIVRLLKKMQTLRQLGQKDIIVDPGIGFGKTLDENYEVMSKLELYHSLDVPLLVGVSRKSMIQNVLNCSADEALNGTTVLNTAALMRGADILRVHDVKEAKETVKIYCRL